MQWCLLIMVLLAGCTSYKPVTYEDDDGIKPGPGLVSGDDGEIVIYAR
ncbi:MAG: hypothetical protein ACPGXY_05675 [Alphaproteobacteria bacterium]